MGGVNEVVDDQDLQQRALLQAKDHSTGCGHSPVLLVGVRVYVLFLLEEKQVTHTNTQQKQHHTTHYTTRTTPQTTTRRTPPPPPPPTHPATRRPTPPREPPPPPRTSQRRGDGAYHLPHSHTRMYYSCEWSQHRV